MTKAQPKKPFSTRIAVPTLDQLDRLVRSGKYPNRTAAIEAAVAQLANAEVDQAERRQRAFAASCGALSIGITPESMHAAELDRLDWEAGRTRGG